MTEPCIGIIGGSGLYDTKGTENIKSIEIETPYGKSSDALLDKAGIET